MPEFKRANTASEVRAQIHQLDAQYQRERGALLTSLAAIEAACHGGKHYWGDSIYEPIVHEAFTDPGDPPGTMGVDWRGPMSCPRREEPRWKRICHDCQKVEYTTNVQQREVAEPRW
jgi:hypothetical protein